MSAPPPLRCPKAVKDPSLGILTVNLRNSEEREERREGRSKRGREGKGVFIKDSRVVLNIYDLYVTSYRICSDHDTVLLSLFTSFVDSVSLKVYAHSRKFFDPIVHLSPYADRVYRLLSFRRGSLKVNPTLGHYFSVSTIQTLLPVIRVSVVVYGTGTPPFWSYVYWCPGIPSCLWSETWLDTLSHLRPNKDETWHLLFI